MLTSFLPSVIKLSKQSNSSNSINENSVTPLMSYHTDPMINEPVAMGMAAG